VSDQLIIAGLILEAKYTSYSHPRQFIASKPKIPFTEQIPFASQMWAILLSPNVPALK